jgi:hypothetical protein
MELAIFKVEFENSPTFVQMALALEDVEVAEINTAYLHTEVETAAGIAFCSALTRVIPGGPSYVPGDRFVVPIAHFYRALNAMDAETVAARFADMGAGAFNAMDQIEECVNNFYSDTKHTSFVVIA